ncbi:LysR family transcriptional regulator [Xylocopilactobacillus apicola]|uniref:LysR family transcriptional regulator n=1 Tax=Xylocopilactobacillus apicola TaxID=2932184 RepID=A0AAU9D068_9LACO|nr:LysR family transcriptional regulator [Xylocopilactobacillus apicola]BDR59654.1 LysR family transcriptional regulator [Xylocopilactobacillus apicola]
MIDNNLLEELVTFEESGTLAAAAEKLRITQPSMTRGMQRLEAELGVKLFERQPNRLTLTKTGEFAVELAKSALKVNRDLKTQVQNFAQAEKMLKIGLTIPGPKNILDKLELNVEVTTDLQSNEQISTLLNERAFSLIFSNQELLTDQIESRYVGTERLLVNLDQFSYRANQQSITFSELKGQSFIVLRAIGPWRALIQEQIPDATFMYQEEQVALAQLTKYSSLPYFTTNLSALTKHRLDDNRHSIPISDDSAQMPVYANYLITDKKRVLPVLQAVSDYWPKDK